MKLYSLVTCFVAVSAEAGSRSLRRHGAQHGEDADNHAPVGGRFVQEANRTTNASAHFGAVSDRSDAWRRAAIARSAAIGRNATAGNNIPGQMQQCNIIGQFAAEPSLCKMGNDRFTWADMTAHIPVFLNQFKIQQMHLPSHCCMGVNHMFALSFMIQALQPAFIIESGVAAGHQTFLLRLAAPDTPIISIDPVDPSVGYAAGTSFGHWKDPSGKTTYLTGPAFKDLSELDFNLYIPDLATRARTLIILDDHQSSVERLRLLQRWGFKWAFYEDNYPLLVATSNDQFTCLNLGNTMVRDFPVIDYAFGDAYSPNAVCGAPLPAIVPMVLYKDLFGTKCKYITPAQHNQAVAYYQNNVAAYFEFPALFTACTTTRPPLLGQDPSILVTHGLPTIEMELWNYGHLFPPFIELAGTPDPGDPITR